MPESTLAGNIGGALLQLQTESGFPRNAASTVATSVSGNTAIRELAGGLGLVGVGALGLFAVRSGRIAGPWVPLLVKPYPC
jgi:hypothetical protein